MAFPKKNAYLGRVHALHTAAGPDGPLAAVRPVLRCGVLLPHQHRFCMQVAIGDGTLLVIDTSMGKTLFTQRGAHACAPLPLASSHSLPAGKALQQPSASVTAACLSPCGRLAASAGVDNAVRVWSTDEGALLATFVGHAAPPKGLLWSADAALLASGGGDAAPRVWRVPTLPE